MKKVKITVLKTTLDKELAAEYGVPGMTQNAGYAGVLHLKAQCA